MKNDMRITYPLWQAGSILTILLIVIGFSLTSSFTWGENGFEVLLNFEGPNGIFLIGALAIAVIYSIIFVMRVSVHNKNVPKHKIKLTSWKPQEYMEDDELFQEVTRQATKKVYTFFVWSIPFLAGAFIVLPLGRTIVITGLMALSLGQYFIYFKEIRGFLKEAE